MNQSNVSLLDLPNEILIIILMKRDIMDVLYSMMNIGNQRVANLVPEKTFTKSLNFVLITPNDNIFSIDDSILNRFYINILPRIDHNVKSLILESVSVQRILLSANCPNLTELKIFKLQRTNLCTAFCRLDSLLSLRNLPLTIYSSLILYKLCINLNYFEDCLALLDDRFNQLHTLKGGITFIDQNSKINNK
ncbi:unnamed protein product, partial [Rotaria sp. Silwood2]